MASPPPPPPRRPDNTSPSFTSEVEQIRMESNQIRQRSGADVLLHYRTVAAPELIGDVYPHITLVLCSWIYYSFNCVAQICEILLRLIIELCCVRPSAGGAAVVVGGR